MTDDELLERIAARDPEKWPIAERAEKALRADQEDSS